MKAIIMAAGVGSRLSRVTGDGPKCLLRIGDRTMIDRTIALLHSKGIVDIAVVVGYQAAQIREHLGDTVRYHDNPFYPITNSIASLWMAREELTGPALLMNADVYFESKIVDILLAETRPAVLLSDSSRLATADYKFSWNGDQIVRYGKDIPVAEAHGEYVGIAKVSGEFMPMFRDRLETLIRAQNFRAWWEDALYSFISEGTPIFHRDIAGKVWGEVDFIEDYERLLAMAGSRQDSVRPLRSRVDPLERTEKT
ncbi:MAG: NTP transferase domain-containing protein [Polyangiales bacterium]